MKLDPVNLLGGFYQDDNLPWSSQDTVNWLPRPAEQAGTISPLKLAGVPGLDYLTEIDDAPIRVGGMRNVEGKLFVVAGTTLHEVSTSFVATARGTIPGVGPVSMSHNQQEFGNELTVVNGDSGYVFNTFTNSFSQINDDAFNGSVQVDYLNRRNIHMDPFGRFMFPSEIDTAGSFDSLDRTDSEASPDRFVGLGVNQLELVGFSQRTIEFYQDTGATEQPFRPKHIAIQRGCASRNSIVQLGTLMWLGDDGIFYALNGYQEQAISTGPIQKAIEDEDWSQCFGFIWEDRKHKVAYWTFPSGKTWGYDAWTGLWHRRQSFGMDRWRLNALVKWNDRWIGGDFRRGRLYALNWDTFHEAGQPLIATRTAPPIYSNGNTVVCPLLELQFDTGRGGRDISLLGNVALTGDFGDGMVFAEYSSGPLTVINGEAPYMWSASLPDGLGIDPDTGVVSGVVTVAGAHDVIIRVVDATGRRAELSQSISFAFGPNLLIARTNNMTLRSGASSAYAEIQSITTAGGGTVLDLVNSNGGQYMALCNTGTGAGTFFKLYKRNNLGAYLDDTANVDIVPTSTVQGAAFTHDGAYLAVIFLNNNIWLYKFNGTGYTRVQTVASTNLSGKASWDSTGTRLVTAGISHLARIWLRTADSIAVASTITASNNGGGIAWRGNQVLISGWSQIDIHNVNAAGVSTLAYSLAISAAYPDCCWTEDGSFIFVMNNLAPFLRKYTWNGVTIAAATNPTQPGFGSGSHPSMSMSADNRLVAFNVDNIAGGTAIYTQSAGVLTPLTTLGTLTLNCPTFTDTSDYLS